MKWQIGATVIDIGDLDQIFSEVRLGDPVRGFLSYDLATPHFKPDPHFLEYIHDAAFEVAGLVIENPRDGSKLTFRADEEFPFLKDIIVFNDIEDEIGGDFDAIYAHQTVVAPDGFSGPAPTVEIDLVGPSDFLPDTGLPGTLNLDDWPHAVILFKDFFDGLQESGESPSFVAAEIHTLTPVELPTKPGEFNGDGTVNAADYTVWRDALGVDYTQHDYEVWRGNYGLSVGSQTHSSALPRPTAVPEPVSCILLALGVLAMFAQGCRCVPHTH